MEIYILGVIVNKFYVYQYRDPRNNEVIYIGKGQGGRAYHHLTRCHNPILRGKIQHIREQNLEPIIEFVLENATEEYAHFIEETFIAAYGRINLGTGTLCNFTDGGEGTSGMIISEEHRKRIGDAAQNRTPEALRRISESSKNRRPSAETIKKRSESMRNRIVSEETRQKQAEIARNRVFSDETRNKMSETQKQRLAEKPKKVKPVKQQNPEETRKKLSEAARNRARLACPHCGKEMDSSSYTRYHGDKCKQRK